MYFGQSIAAIHTTGPLQLDDAVRQKIDKCVSYKQISSISQVILKVKSSPVVVFMKGTQEEPMCGFSRNVKLVDEEKLDRDLLLFFNVKFAGVGTPPC
jgi:hypothetical protein